MKMDEIGTGVALAGWHWAQMEEEMGTAKGIIVRSIGAQASGCGRGMGGGHWRWRRERERTNLETWLFGVKVTAKGKAAATKTTKKVEVSGGVGRTRHRPGHLGHGIRTIVAPALIWIETCPLRLAYSRLNSPSISTPYALCHTEYILLVSSHTSVSRIAADRPSALFLAVTDCQAC